MTEFESSFIPEDTPQGIHSLAKVASTTAEVRFDKEAGLLLLNNQGRVKVEQRHPFQDLLYQLREAGLKTSTSEWLDLQAILEAGVIESIEDLYTIGRSLLVKDVTGFPAFDRIFGYMFYGIGKEEKDDSFEEQNDEQEQEIELDVEQEEQDTEEEQVKEQNDSQEIVEPGETEEHHGGDDVHKEIEGSQSSGHEGGGEPKDDGKGGGQEKEAKGGEGTEQNDNGGGKTLEGKGGKSIQERLLERKYDAFDRKNVLHYEQFGRAVARLVSVLEETTQVRTGRLDARATVQSISRNAGLPEFRWREEEELKPNVVVMFDVGGSTDEFRPIMEKLFAAVQDYVQGVEIYYFHNAVYGEVWPQKDGNWGEHFVPLEKLLKKDSNTKFILIGDAWMAYNELHERGETDDSGGTTFPSGIDSFQKLRDRFNSTVWINPILATNHDEWDDSGTIADVKDLFPMFDLSLDGIEKAVDRLLDN